MRKQHNIKSTPSFTRAFVELELGLPLSIPMAYVDGHEVAKVEVAHAWARGTMLSDIDSALEFIEAVRYEHGGAVPVIHRMARSYNHPTETCLGGVFGELIAS